MVVDPDQGIPTHVQGEVQVTLQWRPEPTHVEKCGDRGVGRGECQSNLEIASSLRNSFRASLKVRVLEVGRALIELGPLPGYRIQSNSEYQ